MKLKLILFQNVFRFRLIATILHPPIERMASSLTLRQGGEVKNALIDETFKIFILSTGCHGHGAGAHTDGNGGDDDDGDATNNDDDNKDDIRIFGIHAPTTAKLK